jgi:phage baseplate assembly protein W
MQYEDRLEIPFIGKGWAFPPKFNKARKQIEMVSGLDDIRQSLIILLSTEIGERFIHPDFGTDIKELLFQPLDNTLENYMADKLKSAITLHEPRIYVDNIGLEHIVVEGLINISIEFTVRSTNTRSNMVYPYYLKEGTNL